MPRMLANTSFWVSEAEVLNVSDIIAQTLDISKTVNDYEKTKVKESLFDIVILTMFFGA